MTLKNAKAERLIDMYLNPDVFHLKMEEELRIYKFHSGNLEDLKQELLKHPS